MAPAHRIPLLALLLALPACGSPTEAERLLEDVDRAEARWVANGPETYDVVERRICECLPSETGPVLLRVTRVAATHVPEGTETIVSGTYVPTGGEVQPGQAVPEETLALFVTAGELFDLIRSAIADGAHTVAAEFDPTLGYPTSVDILPDPQIPDSGIGYRLTVVN